jgi:hypothetical protein
MLNVMRWILILLCAVVASPALAQEAEVLVTDEQPAPKPPTVLEKWGITFEQYLLIDPSRRPGGDTYKYWRERKRGPYGNLLERIPGGPRRPVRF